VQRAKESFEKNRGGLTGQHADPGRDSLKFHGRGSWAGRIEVHENAATKRKNKFTGGKGTELGFTMQANIYLYAHGPYRLGRSEVAQKREIGGEKWRRRG